MQTLQGRGGDYGEVRPLLSINQEVSRLAQISHIIEFAVRTYVLTANSFQISQFLPTFGKNSSATHCLQQLDFVFEASRLLFLIVVGDDETEGKREACATDFFKKIWISPKYILNLRHDGK